MTRAKLLIITVLVSVPMLLAGCTAKSANDPNIGHQAENNGEPTAMISSVSAAPNTPNNSNQTPPPPSSKPSPSPSPSSSATPSAKPSSSPSGILATPANVPVLTYHSVNDTPIGMQQLSVTTKDFDAQIKYLSEHGFESVDFIALKNIKAYTKPIIITFDDGYEDNFSKAYPILKKYNFRATIFLITDRIGKKGYLTTDEITQMTDLISFQSHTVTHPDLTKIGAKQLTDELTQSKDYISKLTGHAVYAFAYPGGTFNDTAEKAVSQFYDYAVTTKFGYNKTGFNTAEMKRIMIVRSFVLSDFTGDVGK